MSSITQKVPLLKPPSYKEDGEIILRVISRLRHLQYLGCGRGRMVYASKDFVYKIPYTINARQFNLHEAQSFKDDPYAKARCRIIHIHSVPILVMERLELNHQDFDYLYENLDRERIDPLTVDGIQAGVNKKGKVKFFDFDELLLGAGEPLINIQKVTGFPRHCSTRESSEWFKMISGGKPI